VTAAVSPVVRDAKPPAALIRVLNPVMRVLLCTPVARLIRPFALLEFSGRRSGRRFLVPVGWHSDGRNPVVFTPAPWRANFAEPRDVVVRYRGRTQRMVGTLVPDAADVAAALNAVIAAGEPASRMGIKAPGDHVLTPDDVCLVDRQAIRFQPC